MSTTKEHTLRYTYYDREEEMPGEDLSLVEKALAAREKAYAQYSGFMVGAAVLLENGVVVTGNNQENAAYPSGLCAERVAVYHAGAEYPGVRMLKIAICGGKKGSSSAVPVAPCGACRQAILEYSQKQGSPIEIIFAGTTPVPAVKAADIEDLLPFSFGRDFL